MKWCLTFEEDIRPLVLNDTNAALIHGITGHDDTDQWNGAKIVLYNEPTVMYAGKVTGGIRVRAPRQAKAAPAAAPAPTARPQATPPSQMAEPPEEDDVPF